MNNIDNVTMLDYDVRKKNTYKN